MRKNERWTCFFLNFSVKWTDISKMREKSGSAEVKRTPEATIYTNRIFVLRSGKDGGVEALLVENSDDASESKKGEIGLPGGKTFDPGKNGFSDSGKFRFF